MIIALVFGFHFYCSPIQAQFYLNGDAKQLNDTCFQLTEDRINSAGSIWNAVKIDLRLSFDAIIEVNLGCKDSDGADGMVLGLQPVSTSIGGVGEGIGFDGIVPSLGIELDTWQNGNLSDPGPDHIAIIRNGNLDHASNNTLSGPVNISANSSNVEDCSFHELRIVWDAEAMVLETFFDCEFRLSYVGDIVNDIFRGDPEVFWGVTSATGGAFNEHKVCFTYTTFLDRLEDITMCPEGQVTLEARGGTNYLWEPAAGLSNPNIPNPVATPDVTTDYVVTITDDCGKEFSDSITVFVEGPPLQLDLGPDATFCEGDEVQIGMGIPDFSYEWNDGVTDAVREVMEPGTYQVTATSTLIYCIGTDEIVLEETLLPAISFGVPDTNACPGETLVLEPFFRGALPVWPDGSQQPTYAVSQAQGIIASVSNECGFETGIIRVSFDPCDDLYVPSAFSPNGDGVNDIFTVYDNGDVVEVMSFQVFDRWGDLVFSVNNFLPGDSAPAWDGRYHSKAMPVDTYVYQVLVRFRDGSSDVRSGEVVLMR